MYRDFSEKSRNELLGLVSQVENDKRSDFTDWVGDRWYDFESWIGKLNIKNYLNDVNQYHKKVIDKNNAAKNTINTIFDKVKLVDISYKDIFQEKRTQLEQCQRFIEELSQIVNPSNGKFNANYILYAFNREQNNIRKDEFENIRKYLAEIIDKSGDNIEHLFRLLTGNCSSSSELISSLILQVLMKNMYHAQNNDLHTNENIKTGLNFISKINKNVGKYTNNEGVTLSSTFLSYLSTLCGIVSSTDSKSGFDITSYTLTLVKSSLDVENGIYKYFEKTLHPYEVSKLDTKFGKTMTGISLLSGLIGTTEKGIDTYKVFIDTNSSVYDKAAQSIKMSGSVFDLGGKVYIASQTGTKTLQFISSASGSKEVVNQILVTEQKLQYATSAAVKKKISNVSMIAGLVSVGASTISSGTKRYGEVIADGKFEGKDAGSVGVHGSLGGLDTVTSTLSLGLIDIDSEKVAGELETVANDFVNSDSWAANYIRDQDNNAVLRFGVSVGVGAYIVGENIVEGVADVGKRLVVGCQQDGIL